MLLNVGDARDALTVWEGWYGGHGNAGVMLLVCHILGTWCTPTITTHAHISSLPLYVHQSMFIYHLCRPHTCTHAPSSHTHSLLTHMVPPHTSSPLTHMVPPCTPFPFTHMGPPRTPSLLTHVPPHTHAPRRSMEKCTLLEHMDALFLVLEELVDGG